MAEQLDLTTPVTTPDITSWRVVYLELNWAAQSIRIGLLGTNGETSHHNYNGEVAETMMINLNKVNLSTTSLQRRILERLLADGLLVGSISGTPD